MSPDAYRPYPHPSTPYVMHQSWHNLLFIHWRVPVNALRAVIPKSMPLDTFEGNAYIGVVPFLMRDVRPRFIPPFPWLSAFPELNVRTYITLNGRPGVYFFSLDAANPVAVEIARTVFHLPYRNAVMECIEHNGVFTYGSSRTDHREPPAYFRAIYQPTGAPYIAPPDSLEYFLTARYSLYTTDTQGGLLRAEIHHPPWQLQTAAAQIETNTMTAPFGLTLPSDAPLLHFSRALDVIVWLPQRINTLS